MYSLYMVYFDADGIASDANKMFDNKYDCWNYIKRCVARAAEIGYCLDFEVSHDCTVVYNAFYYSDGKVHIRYACKS